MTTNEPPNKVRRIKIYECSNYSQKLLYEEGLKQCGAIIQDHRVFFKDDTVEFKYTLNVSYGAFVADLKATPVIWNNLDLQTINTGSI